MANVFKHVLISDEMAYPGILIDHPEIESQDDVACTQNDVVHDGYFQDLTDGIDQENARFQEQISSLNALLHSIPEAISKHRHQLSAEIADIVLLIANKFFITQQKNKESIVHQITQIIDQLNNRQNITIALHPQDLTLLEKGDIQIDIASCENMRLVPDDDLRLGGCIVKSEHGVFDAGIERQIDSLKHVLLQMRGIHE